MQCPYCAEEISDEALVCAFCGSDLRAVASPADPMAEAPPGQGSRSPVPPEVDKRSWLGFWSPIIYGLVNHVWMFTLVGVALIAASFFIPTTLTRYLGYASLGLSGVALQQGNRLAWQSRTWQSIAAFRATQRRWAWVGFATTTVLTILVIVSLVGGGTTLTSYEAHGVTFSPPSGWRFDEGATRLTGLSSEALAWNDAFFPTDAETTNLITIGRSTGAVPPPSPDELDAVAQQIARTFADESIGTPIGSPMAGTDLPTVKVDSQLQIEDASIGKRVYFIFGDGGVFVVRCQYDDASQAETLDACDLIARTFTLAPPAS